VCPRSRLHGVQRHGLYNNNDNDDNNINNNILAIKDLQSVVQSEAEEAIGQQ